MTQFNSIKQTPRYSYYTCREEHGIAIYTKEQYTKILSNTLNFNLEQYILNPNLEQYKLKFHEYLSMWYPTKYEVS